MSEDYQPAYHVKHHYEFGYYVYCDDYPSQPIFRATEYICQDYAYMMNMARASRFGVLTKLKEENKEVIS